jgi:hypothetical protein
MHLFYAISSLFYALCFIVMINPSLIQKYNLKFYWKKPLHIILNNNDDNDKNNDNDDNDDNDNNDDNNNNYSDNFKDSDDESSSDKLSNETNKTHNFTKDAADLTTNILKAMTELSIINKRQYKLVKVQQNQTDDVVSESDIFSEYKIQKDMSFITDLDID